MPTRKSYLPLGDWEASPPHCCGMPHGRLLSYLKGRKVKTARVLYTVPLDPRFLRIEVVMVLRQDRHVTLSPSSIITGTRVGKTFTPVSTEPGVWVDYHHLTRQTYYLDRRTADQKLADYLVTCAQLLFNEFVCPQAPLRQPKVTVGRWTATTREGAVDIDVVRRSIKISNQLHGTLQFPKK